MSHIAVITVNVVAEAPCPGHGDTEANPKPAPTARSMRDTDAATTAPARIAGHDTAELNDSTVVDPSVKDVSMATPAQ